MFGLRNKTMDILTYGDARLAETAAPVEEIDDEVSSIGKRMIATMNSQEGLGLAGPQVGIGLRIVALGMPSPKNASPMTLSPGEMILLPKMPLVLLNPRILSFGAELIAREEGCLSIPGVYAPIERPATVFLRARFINGEVVNVECAGLLARALQHEIDHLNGILFVDRLTPKSRKPLKEDLERLKKKP